MTQERRAGRQSAWLLRLAEQPVHIRVSGASGGSGRRWLAEDYPCSVATRHEQMDRDAATPTADRRACGAFAADGSLVAMTSVEVDGADAETDFTVVHPMHRGRGIGTALKAWSVLALQREGVRRFRTGGSADNVAIRRANAALGYVQDEEWVTLTPPDSTDAGT